MSKADILFLKLGYVGSRDENNLYYVHVDTDYVIKFDLICECVYCYNDEDSEFAGGLNKKELLAINKKIKELGWSV